ncbi:hypothetical protein ACFQ07_03645, partial [Actinomadura adrarensis]
GPGAHRRLLLTRALRRSPPGHPGRHHPLLFITSADASFVTGSEFVVDGGLLLARHCNPTPTPPEPVTYLPSRDQAHTRKVVIALRKVDWPIFSSKVSSR